MIEATASYSFPVLGSMRMDYRDDCVYETHDWSVKSGNVRLNHRLAGGGLVSALVKEGEAAFAVVVIMRATMYRKTFIADNSGGLSVAQTVPIEKGRRSIEVPKFLPMVIYRGENKELVAEKSMGLDAFWVGQRFTLHKGAIIARGKPYQFLPGRSHLLKFRSDDGLAEGEIRVEVITADSGYFLVRAHPALYKGINNAPTAKGDDKIRHRDSILTHALSVGFADFAKRYPDEEELQSLENFQAAKTRLEAGGILTWEDGDDFDACKAACFMSPHGLVSDVSEEDNDD